MNANTKDVSAGLLFIAIAALFALGTQELELGTARKLGPGAFPLMLAGVLALLGVIILVKGIRNPAAHDMIAIAPILFGLTVRGLGMVASIAIVVAVSAYSSRRMSLKLALALIVGLTLFCVLVFHVGLGLPVRLIGPWLGG